MSESPAWFRRLLASTWLPTCVIFAVGCVVFPKPLAILTTKHYEAADRDRMLVAAQDEGGGFKWDPAGVPTTLDEEPFVGDSDKSNPPGYMEPLDRAHVIRRDADGVLMETVRSDTYVAVTSRYLVRGRRIVPVSRMSFGILDFILGALLSAIVAAASGSVIARRRRTRSGRAE